MINQKYKPTVSAIIFNADNKVLITHNKSHGTNFWKFPQGGVEKNESLEQAILRELEEELNSTSFRILEKCNLEYKYDWPEEIQEKKGFIGPSLNFFVLRCTDEKSLKPDEEELDGIKWVELNTLSSLFSSLPEFQKTITRLIVEVKEIIK